MDEASRRSGQLGDHGCPERCQESGCLKGRGQDESQESVAHVDISVVKPPNEGTYIGVNVKTQLFGILALTKTCCIYCTIYSSEPHEIDRTVICISNFHRGDPP